VRFKDIIAKKKLVERKIKLFVISIFHGHYGRRKIIEPIPLGNLFLLEKTHLSEINNKCFDDLNILNLQTTLTMSFATLL